MFRPIHPPTEPALRFWDLRLRRLRAAGWRAAITTGLLMPFAALICALSGRMGSVDEVIFFVIVLGAELCIPVATTLIGGGVALLLPRSTRERGEQLILHGAVLVLSSIGAMAIGGGYLKGPPLPASLGAIVAASYLYLIIVYAAYCFGAHRRRSQQMRYARSA